MAVAQKRTVGEYPSRATVEYGYGPTDWLGGWRSLFWGCGILLAINVFLEIWNYKFMYSAGLDSASRAFTLYYRTLFWGELLSVGVFTGLWYGWLVRTGREIRAREQGKVEPREEFRRMAVFWCLIGITSLSLYIEASFWPNWDGAWHQTMVRDTALTPTHIPMFYFWFPLSAVLVLGTYLYGRFRLPRVYGKEKGFPWSFTLLLGAAIFECFQVAMNEWGHSLWIAEEFFATPFHWPFVWYGWLAGGMFALWGETILAMFAIEKEIEEAEQASQPQSTVASEVRG
jgi:methane/ammonia monooxygenase subunit C